MRRTLAILAVALVAALAQAAPAVAVHGGDTEVSVGSNDQVFSQNKQNEPAVAIDAAHPDVVVAGANDNIDMEACNAGDPTTCPFTEGVGVSGVYVSFDRGDSWTQPTYTGTTARHCLGPQPCTTRTGPIGTLPGYAENGLVSDGDPAVAFGPVYRNGTFSWANGSRLYYVNLASNAPGRSAFKGAEAIAVSRLDAPAATGLTPEIVQNQGNWKAPVIVSKQNAALFSDKEQVWADNAASSPFFGHAYVCYAAFRGVASIAQPLKIATSTDGGSTWTDKQVTPAADNTHSRNGFGRSGCTVRTDSHGVVYAFAYQFGVGSPGVGTQFVVRSFDGGSHWTRPQTTVTAVDLCTAFEPSIGRCVIDGIGGARSDLGPAPSVDIANGAPLGDVAGRPASNLMLDAWADGRAGLNHEQVLVSSSSDGARTWTPPRSVGAPGDRGYYAAPALSPDGTDAYVVYNAFTTPFRNDTTSPRSLVGVVLHADVAGATVGGFSELHRGLPGDPRGSSQNNLAAEFLGDYVYAAATNTYGTAVWNDVRNAADCPAIDRYRQALHDEAVASGASVAEPEEPRGATDAGAAREATAESLPPAVQAQCPPTFGNSDIFGGSYADPS
jgi:hypothetical protein